MKDSVGIYLGELTLDMNSFREAQRKLDTDNHHSQDMHKEATQRRINDVRAVQDHYLSGQIVLEEAELASGSTRAGKWVERAVGAAQKNLKRLSKVLRVNEDEIAVVNIWPLNALGTFKKQVVDRMKVSLSALPGVTLVFLTLLPSDTHMKVNKKSSIGSLPSDRGKGSGDELESGSELDHDFDIEEGCLPDVLTKAHAKMPDATQVSSQEHGQGPTRH